MIAALPEIGSWYEDESGGLFNVVAFDPHEGAVEVQYHDGTVEEIDVTSWQEMMPRHAEAPEDWGAGNYDIAPDNYGVDFEDGIDAIEHPLDYFEQEDDR